MKKYKILITGAGGYLGKSLYNVFKDKYDVTAITRKEVDLTDNYYVNDFFKGKYFDVVLHCAVQGGSRLKEDGVDVLDNNLKMYYNLLHNKYHYNKFIHFGSGAIYSQPDKPYGLSKKVINISISEQPNFYDLIIYGLFDENELDTRFIKANIKRYINKQPIVIHENKIMTFFYMRDLVTLVDFIINDKDNYKGTMVHCSYKNHLSLFHIAIAINILDKYQVPINIENKTIREIENYKSPLGGAYGLDYIGLEQGIREVYQKLKNGN